MLRNFVLSILVLGAAACVVHADGDGCSYEDEYVCYLEYTPGYGYERVCEWTVDPLVCVDLGDDDYDGRPPRYSSTPVNSSGGSAGSTSTSGSPSGPPPRSTAPDVGTDIPCSRDGQCGTGLCIAGECFYGCLSDSDCGTGDVCSIVSSTTVCQAPPEPTVECTRTAECGNAQLCLNAVCHDSCDTTEDCRNPLDRCDGSICVPDRSVVSECLLDRECADGEVCIDATCQAR
jgi:Cys-rich repeat protein